MTKPLALVVHAHPAEESYNRHLLDTVVDALLPGHRVEVIDLYAERYDPVMSREELAAYRAGRPSNDPTVARHSSLVLEAHTLVFVYPTWWGSLPAILRGWLERTMRPGVAFEYRRSGGIRPALKSIRHIAGVTTYGSPRWRMLLVGDGGRRMLLRALRTNIPRRVRRSWIGLHAIDTSTPEDRAAFIERVRTEVTSW